MDDQYYVIRTDDNGDSFVDKLTRAELLQRLNEEYYGPLPPYGFGLPSGWRQLPTIPDGAMAEWGETLIIVKGQQVAPLVVTTVTKFDLP